MLSKKHGPSTYKYVKHKQSTCIRSEDRKPDHQKKHVRFSYVTNQIKYNKPEKAIKHKNPVDITPIVCVNKPKIKDPIKRIIIESIKERVVEPMPEIKDTVIVVELKPEIKDAVDVTSIVKGSKVVRHNTVVVVEPESEIIDTVVVVEPESEIKDTPVKKKRSYVVRKAKKSWKWLKSWI